MGLREFDPRYCARLIMDSLHRPNFEGGKVGFLSIPHWVSMAEGRGSVIMGGWWAWAPFHSLWPDANRKIGEIFILQEFYSRNVHRTEIHSNSSRSIV